MIDSSAFQGKKAAYYTLGCKLNFSETSTFGKMLEDMGVITAQKGEKADICLINTCSVTEVADHKCRQAIHRMVRQNPGAFVIVTGCYAQLESENVSKIEGVDLVLGANEKAHLIQYLSDAWAKKFAAKTDFLSPARTWSFGFCASSASQREDQGDQDLPAFMLPWQPYPLFPEGAGWLQLLLHLLHHSFRPWQLPQPKHRVAGGSV